MNNGNIKVKKRMMFIKSEDYYFLTYSIIILLDTLACTDKQRYFLDYRKLSYLIDFISNRKLVYLLEKEKLNDEEIRIMTNVYSSGILRVKEINKLLYSLDKKKIIHLKKDTKSDRIDVSLLRDQIDKDFIDKQLFEYELRNSLKLKAILKRLSGLKYETLTEKLFIEKGVKIWQLF